METTELRQGNLFYPIDRSLSVHLPIETPYKVTSIRVGTIEAIPSDKIPAMVEKHEKFNPYDMCAIPLTEKWLLELGFINSGFMSYTHPMLKGFVFAFSEISDGYIEVIVRGLDMETIKYVHDLQNFFYSVKKRELILTVEEREDVIPKDKNTGHAIQPEPTNSGPEIMYKRLIAVDCQLGVPIKTGDIIEYCDDNIWRRIGANGVISSDIIKEPLYYIAVRSFYKNGKLKPYEETATETPVHP